MQIEVNGREYQCWHELGHAAACLIWGGEVEFIELLGTDHAIGQARARCKPTAEGRAKALCGGFAMEYVLLRSGRLPKVDEREITQVLFKNATIDREMFWNKTPGADISKREDEEFMNVATGVVAPALKLLAPQMQSLVDELLTLQKISGVRIKEVLCL